MKNTLRLTPFLFLLFFSSGCIKDDISFLLNPVYTPDPDPHTYTYSYDSTARAKRDSIRAVYDNLYPPTPEKIDDECTHKGFKLYGKIKMVNSFPDLKVKVVDNFPDLKVKLVSNFADDCGEWQMVDNFPDLKIQFVERFPDITIKYVNSFPGKP